MLSQVYKKKFYKVAKSVCPKSCLENDKCFALKIEISQLHAPMVMTTDSVNKLQFTVQWENLVRIENTLGIQDEL